VWSTLFAVFDKDRKVKSRTHNFPTQASACLVLRGEENGKVAEPTEGPCSLVAFLDGVVGWGYQLDFRG
jgi:hypothetical protein